MSKIFTTKKIGNIEIKNRIVLPPMVTFSFAAENNFVSERNISHYENISKSGTGLIIVEATSVSEGGRLSKDQLGIWSDEYIEGLSKIAKACNKHGSKVFIQLHHAGLSGRSDFKRERLTSSDYDNGKIKARAMTMEELEQIQNDFVQAALRAERAGFDGVELHGAHSYLMTQFFSQKVNRRADQYGGNLDNRLRFTREIFKEIKSIVSKDFVIGIRMGSNESDLATSIQIAERFESLGMDYLHISTGFDNSPIEETVPEDFPCNWVVYGGTRIKEKVNIPVLVVNSIRTEEEIDYLLDNDLADFVAVGRGQLADHNFTKHIKEGQPIVTCLACRPCEWFTNGDNCPRHRQE